MKRIIRTLFGWTCMMTVSLVFAFLVAPRLYSPSAASTTATSLSMKANAPNGTGYWLVGANGGVFAFGTAQFYGSLPQQGIHVHDIVGIVATPSGNGYWLMGADGSVYPFGDARRAGDARGKMLGGAIVGGAVVPASSMAQTYTQFETGASTEVISWPKPPVTVASITIDPPFPGRVLLQAWGTIHDLSVATAVVSCQPRLDGKAIGVAVITEVSGFAPRPGLVTMTGTAQVGSGQQKVIVVCRVPAGSDDVQVSLDGLAIVTRAGSSWEVSRGVVPGQGSGKMPEISFLPA